MDKWTEGDWLYTGLVALGIVVLLGITFAIIVYLATGRPRDTAAEEENSSWPE